MQIATKMMRAATVLVTASAAMLVLGACDKDKGPDDPSQMQNQQPIGYDQNGNPIYPQQGTYPQQPGTYPQQPGAYPQQPGTYPQQPGTYPQQPGAYPQQAPVQSQPSPLALPCQSDFTCGTHKCNLQAGRCAFPCANAQADCAAGMGCANGVCVPGG